MPLAGIPFSIIPFRARSVDGYVDCFFALVAACGGSQEKDGQAGGRPADARLTILLHTKRLRR